MINLVFSIVVLLMPIIVSLWRYKIFKNGEMSKLSNIRNNINCFNCNEKMYSSAEEHLELLGKFNLTSKIFSLKHNKLSTCKSCNREIKINHINKNRFECIKTKFKYFILSDLSDKTILLVITTNIFIIISIFVVLMNINSSSLKITLFINNISLLIYWGSQMVQNLYIRK